GGRDSTCRSWRATSPSEHPRTRLSRAAEPPRGWTLSCVAVVVARRERPDFDGAPFGRRAALRERHRFGVRVAIDQEESADHLLGLGERAVDHARAALAHLHARGLLQRGQRFDAEQQALRLQFVGKALHAREDLRYLVAGAAAALF